MDNEQMTSGVAIAGDPIASVEAIKIVSVKRVCQFNDDVRSGKNKSHFIYDFDVLINGDLRARFRPGVYRGYCLYDAHGTHINSREYGAFARRSDVATKGDFESHIRFCLAKGLIPTLDQLAEAKANRELKRMHEDERQKERDRIDRIRDAALVMLSTLQQAEDYFDARADVNDGSYGIPEPNAEMTILTKIRAAIAKATQS